MFRVQHSVIGVLQNTPSTCEETGSWILCDYFADCQKERNSTLIFHCPFSNNRKCLVPWLCYENVFKLPTRKFFTNFATFESSKNLRDTEWVSAVMWLNNIYQILILELNDNSSLFVLKKLNLFTSDLIKYPLILFHKLFKLINKYKYHMIFVPQRTS